MTDFAALAAPFPPDRVSWRVGSTTQDKKRGMALAYIDARDVMDRLDEVCGPGGWSDRYEVHGSKTICYITIDGVTKADGAGDTDVEAEKGSLSDAFKRAAVKWGIGRYLYDTESPWVEIDQHGRSYAIAKGEHQKLRALLAGGQRKAPEPRQSSYAAICEGVIKCSNDGEQLLQWWNAEQQKERRREELSGDERADLMTKVMARAEELGVVFKRDKAA